MDEEYCLRITDLDVFIGEDWMITVEEEECPSANRALGLRARG